MITADEQSFTAARACLHTLNVPGRQRHAGRKQSSQPKFPHATALGAGIVVSGTVRPTVMLA